MFRRVKTGNRVDEAEAPLRSVSPDLLPSFRLRSDSQRRADASRSHASLVPKDRAERNAAKGLLARAL